MGTEKKGVGFIGLGMMGYPMASRLHAAGYPLAVLDVARDRADQFQAEHAGTVVADDIRGFSDVEVVITMLPGSEAVDAVVLGQADSPGLIAVLQPGATIVDMSSSEPMRSRTLAEALGERGMHFLDAPVSGGVRRAVDGSLAIMVGGDEAQFRRHRDLFRPMGKKLTHLGGSGAGHTMKALNNYVSAAGIIATVEALLVGQEFGLDPDVMTDVLNSSTGKSNTTENKVKQYMLSGSFDSQFALRLLAKDVGIAVDLAESLGQRTELGPHVLRVWAEAARELGESADHTEMYRYIQQAKK